MTPFLVDHSAYDAYALLVESDGKRLFYSGDFRAHGRKSSLFENLAANPPKNIHALLIEGSSIGRIDNYRRFPAEAEIEFQLVEVLSATEGLALIHASSQNIDRMVSIFRAAKKTGRKMVVDLYAAAILEATANPKIPQSFWPEVALFVPQAQRIQIKKNGSFDLLRRHSSHRIYTRHLEKAPGKFVLLFRPLHAPDLECGRCLSNATYIYSQWDGYWEEGTYDGVKKFLTRHGIPKVNVHTSGHASPVDLKKFAAALNPRRIVPIHSFMPQRYPELFPNVEFHGDGEWWEV